MWTTYLILPQILQHDRRDKNFAKPETLFCLLAAQATKLLNKQKYRLKDPVGLRKISSWRGKGERRKTSPLVALSTSNHSSSTHLKTRASFHVPASLDRLDQRAMEQPQKFHKLLSNFCAVSMSHSHLLYRWKCHPKTTDISRAEDNLVLAVFGLLVWKD